MGQSDKTRTFRLRMTSSLPDTNVCNGKQTGNPNYCEKKRVRHFIRATTKVPKSDIVTFFSSSAPIDGPPAAPALPSERSAAAKPMATSRKMQEEIFDEEHNLAVKVCRCLHQEAGEQKDRKRTHRWVRRWAQRCPRSGSARQPA